MMSDYATEVESMSPTLAFQLLGSSPFASDPTFLSRNVQLLPIDHSKSGLTKYSSLELLNTLGDGFRNDEYYDTVNRREQVDLKQAWRNISIPEYIPQCTTIKFLVRRGIPDDLRQKAWKSISGWTALSKEKPNMYTDALHRAFGGKSPAFFRNYPLFGGLISPSDHHLIPEADELVKRLLVVIGLEFPTMDYCPVIPDLIQILLTFLSEADTFGVISCLINRSKGARQFLLLTKHEHDSFINAFMKVIAKQLPRLHKHIVSLKIPNKEAHNFLYTWFSRMFVASFPYQVVLRIFDSFVNEGVKVLYRFALAVLEYNRDALLRTTTSKEFRQVLSSHTTACCSVDGDLLIKKAFAYRLRRKDLDMTLPAHNPIEDSLPVFYRPKIAQPSAIIEDDKFEILWAWIPHRICIQDPLLVYSAEKHGWSLSTIAHRCKNESPLLVILKSDTGAVIGAYISHPLSTAKGEFYGDRECFLWTLRPGTSCYRWTMKNDCFLKGTPDYFAIGAGGSGYGLYIHKDMWGRSDPCDTFDNPPLDPVKPDHFQILAMEIYAFR